TLKLANGSIAHMELTWAGDDRKTSFELTGDKGMLRYDNSESTPVEVDFYEHTNETMAADMILTKSIHERQVEHILTCYQSNRSPAVMAQSVTDAVEIAQAANESVAMGEPVSLKGGEEV